MAGALVHRRRHEPFLSIFRSRIWNTVYYERRYTTSCCLRLFEDENSSSLIQDFFDQERVYQTCKGAVPYFDIPPDFAEEEASQLRQVADVIGAYPGVRDYACVSGGTYCVPGTLRWSGRRRSSRCRPTLTVTPRDNPAATVLWKSTSRRKR